MGNKRGKDKLFITFSAPGVPGTPLGHPRGPKWSPDLPQEPPGPPIGRQFLMIFAQFWILFFGFGRFVASFSLKFSHANNKERTRHGGGDSPQGNWITVWLILSIEQSHNGITTVLGTLSVRHANIQNCLYS